VAAIIARAAGCDPGEKLWKSLAKGFSHDIDLVFDDTQTIVETKPGVWKRRPYKWGENPKRDAQRRVVDQIDIDELRELCPHRHVVRKSETDEWEYPDRSEGDPAPVGDEWLVLKEQAEAQS
jgi:hypothetical protein